MSHQEFLNEPLEVINRAFLIWSQEADRDKLEEERRKAA
jgi:hypothetical protein